MIDKIILSSPIRYLLRDSEGSPYSKRKFYAAELQKVKFSEYPYDTYKIVNETKEKYLLSKINGPETKKKYRKTKKTLINIKDIDKHKTLNKPEPQTLFEKRITRSNKT